MTPKESSLENTKAQMRKGILEFSILLIISRDRTYASEILIQLKDADLLVVEGTLYPILSRLRGAGLLAHSWEESPSGPPRKYYTLTEAGRHTLTELKKTWKTLASSITTLIK